MAVCGNSMMESGEQCDDANVIDFDGCSSKCVVEHPEVCPGTAIPLASGQTVTIDDSTAGASDKFVGSRNGIPNSNCINGTWPGPDLIYQVIPQASGTLTAVLDPSYSDVFLRIRTGCPASPNEEVACQYKGGGGPGNLTVTLAVTAGTPYYVAADTWNNKSGKFKLTLTLKP